MPTKHAILAELTANELRASIDFYELAVADRRVKLPWCINTGKSLIPLTLRFLAQKRNLLIPLELSRVMHQGSPSSPKTQTRCQALDGGALHNDDR